MIAQRAPRKSRIRFALPPRLTLAEWADQYRVLAQGYAAEPGPWRTSRTPYLREIMDAIADPDVREVVVMKSAQIGATEGLINNGVGYFADQDPAPMLVVQPSETDAEDWSKTKLAPMIAATPRLRDRFTEPRARVADNTILVKQFPGGFLKVVGATSPKGLRRTAARLAFLDEVDGYPASAGPEGDPVALVAKRLTTYPDRKLVLISTPTIKGASRIERAWLASDQRHYHVPCPHCGLEQVLRWGGPKADYGIKWDEGAPATAAYLCPGCAALIPESAKAAIVAAGRWIAAQPDARVPGFHLNALVSPFDGARWGVLAEEFLVAKDDHEQLQVFINTVLGETWEERAAKFKPEELQGRAERYGDGVEVPDGVGLLTAGVDVQGDRLELLVRGWGAGEESWGVLHERIVGDPQQAATWSRLETLLTRPYRHASSAELRIWCTMCDTGYLADVVYGFVRQRQTRNVFAAKGVATLGREPLQRATKANRHGVVLWTIATVPFKDLLFGRLAIGRPGPRYVHFPVATPTGGFDAEYFAQLGAEKVVRERGVRRYQQIRDRNEAIDLEVLNLAALHALGLGAREQLAELAAQHRTGATTDAKPTPAGRPSARPRLPRRGWVDRW